MNTVLIVLGVLGLGAIVIAAYVFTVAARNYVSENNATKNVTDATENVGQEDEKRIYVIRSSQERRQFTGKPEFPMTLTSGDVIPFDRRKDQDRRALSA